MVLNTRSWSLLTVPSRSSPRDAMVVIVLDPEQVQVQSRIDDKDVSWISLARLVLQFPACPEESSGLQMTINMKGSKGIAIYVKSTRH